MALERSPLQYKGVRAIAPPDLTIAERAPLVTDKAYVKGQLWLDIVGLASYQWSGTTWITLGSGTIGSINSITGDSGGPQVPLAGNFSILGTASQITVTGSANKVTLSVPAVFVAPGSIRATSTLTATLGAITATNGNIVKGSAGNKDIYSSVGSSAAAGANSAGTVALVGGTIVVSTTAVTVSSLIRLTCQGLGTVVVPSALCVSAKSAGVSFTILASQATDTSTIFWEIVN